MWIQTRRNKYNATKTYHNGIVYHSKFEASIAQELDLRIKAKELKGWDRQVKFEFWLYKKGKNWILTDKVPSNTMQKMHLTNYYLDFVAYRVDGIKEFIEVKGMETAGWKLKWRLLESLYGDDKMVELKVIK